MDGRHLVTVERGRSLGAGACFIGRGRSVSCRGCNLEKQGDIHVHPDCASGLAAEAGCGTLR